MNDEQDSISSYNDFLKAKVGDVSSGKLDKTIKFEKRINLKIFII